MYPARLFCNIFVFIFLFSICHAAGAVEGDFNADSSVNWLDIGLFADQWLNTSGAADFNGSGMVDGTDYSLLANNWMKTVPQIPLPVSLWRLNETSGTSAYDSTGNGHNGTVSANVVWAPAGGKYGGAAVFDNDNTNNISVPTAGMNPNAGTITLWAKPTGTMDLGYFFGHNNGPDFGQSTSRIQLKTTQSTPKLLRAQIAGSTSACYVDVAPLTLNTWIHMALTWSGTGGSGTGIAYVNGGTIVKTINYTQSAAMALDSGAQIGNADVSTSFYTCKAYIDEVAVWNCALSASDVNNVYKNGAPIPPGPATNPGPSDGAIAVSLSADLSWTAGSGATSHDVYFGTVDPPPFVGNQTSTSYDPGSMVISTAYYWRVTAKNIFGQVTGGVWSFTTVGSPGPATGPDPADGASAVSTTADLNWTAGYGTTSHYVYFGTTNPPPYKTTRTAANYDPVTMATSTVYYWRIDEKDSVGSIAVGNVWSFKTERAVTAKYPNPSDGAYDVSRTADLRWTAASGATSFNVYFGTSKADVTAGTGGTAKGAQTGTMYNLGKLPLGTKYYWRIDDNPVWEFTALAVQETETLAFPGAGGPGKHAEGGRGGIVLKVTSLGDSGAGSLREAIEDYRGTPRTIVFDVAGYIDLSSIVLMKDYDEGHITIAGQTAPGGGVCIKGNQLKVCRDSGPGGPQHIIIRYVRFRPGAGDEGDAFGVNSGTDMIFDHCSFSWSIDEAFSITQTYHHRGVLDNVTVQWCIVAEPLNESWQHWDPKEKYHGFCSLIQGGWNNQYTYHHNLYANALDRMPRLGNAEDKDIDPNGWLIDWRNNVVYNWGRDNAGYTDDSTSITHQNFVNNYYLAGPDSTDNRIYKEVGGYNLGYYGGNWMNGVLAADQWGLVTSSSCRNCPLPHLQSQQFTPRDPIATDDAPTAYVKVLAGGGATLPARDSADVRTVNGVLTDTGRIIDCVTSDPYPHSTGIAQAGTSNTITLAVTCSANDGWFNGEWVEITGGTGQGQTRTITGYAGATKVAAVDVNWTVIPDSTSAYQLIHPCTKNAGGWPVIAIGNPRADADGDGMADEWEAMYSLSSGNASDRNLDPDNDGYTNLEEYLNNSDPKISDIVP